MNSPTPGLQGDYTDSCVVCFTPTDTGLGFAGEAEWIIAGMVRLGIDQDQALATLAAGDPKWRPVGMVPSGETTAILRVCGDCAGKPGFPVALITAYGELPLIQPRVPQ